MLGTMGRSGLPRRRVCPDCGAQLHERAWRHQSKRCPGYSDLWAMDVYVCFGENRKAHGTEAVLFSITAPGADELPWDESACTVAGPHRHSGELGCQVEAGQATLWNESAQHRFSTAQREAKRRADVALRKLGSARRISKCLSWWELQKRGVLHAHVVLPMGDAEERFWSRKYVQAWEELAPRFWFGFVDRWQRIEGKAEPSEKVGRYVAGYTLGGKGKVPLERAVRDLRLPARTFHINRRLTAQSKATIRNARLNRRLDAASKGRCDWPRLTEEELLAALWFRFRVVAADQRGTVVGWMLEALPEEARAP
jgi:hypothetical protein